MSNHFLGVVIAIFLVFAGIFVLASDKTEDASSPGKGAKGSVTEHTVGQGTAGVTLLEYGDFQCPVCGQYYPILKQVKAKYGDQIKFQFRHFPLVSIHQNAFAGSRAAEAAGLQGKFWEMHDQLFENQQQWSQASSPVSFFKQYAQRIGLKAGQFEKDYASSKVNGAINADMAAGNKLKITGTPGFFLNGKKVEVSQSLAAFEKVIEAEIAKNKLPKSGSD